MDDTKFTVGGVPLEKYFSQTQVMNKVTRGEMRQLMVLLTSKAAVHEAMKVLEFNLRQSLRGMIEEERAAMREAIREEIKSESGIVLLP